MVLFDFFFYKVFQFLSNESIFYIPRIQFLSNGFV